MQHLNNYNIVPNDVTKRKLDYYYGPYHPGNNNQKYMDFKVYEEEVKWEKYVPQNVKPKPSIKVLPKIQYNQVYRDKLDKIEEEDPPDPKEIGN